MIIGIDSTFTPHGGSLTHLEEFVKEISKTYPSSKIFLYLKKENINLFSDKMLNSCTLKVIKMASYGNFFRVLWSQLVLPVESKYTGVELLFCPGNFSPIIKSTRIKAQWIANIGPFCKDMYAGLNIIGKIYLLIYKWLILLSCRSSNIIIHQSEYSKILFEKKYNLKKENQYLIQCGKDDFYKPSTKKTNSSNIISSISHNDILCVSHLFPYKNIESLIIAFGSYNNGESYNSKLFIVGKKMSKNYYLKLEKIVSNLGLNEKIFFTGMANKEELKYAYSICKLFVFPSFCESSAYTLIEAMSCGSAILTSNKTAMPYTCQNAAEYFNPYDEKDLLFKFNIILKDDKKLNYMKKKSLERASQMINFKDATLKFLKIANNK